MDKILSVILQKNTLDASFRWTDRADGLRTNKRTGESRCERLARR